MATKSRGLRGEQISAYVLIAPLLILLTVFILYPVLSNFYYAFTKWRGFGEASWIGTRNFLRVIKDDKFWIALKNTAILILYIPLGTFVPLIISDVLRDGLKGWVIYRAILYLPAVLGEIILGILFNVFFRNSGPLNIFLENIGLGSLALNWLGSSRSAIHMVGSLFIVWMNIGFGCIYFLAAMSTISKDLYDAARIDGAGWFRMFFSVTIPSIRFAVEFWVVLLFIAVFARAFGFLYTFTGGGPGFSTWTLEFGIYKLGFRNFQMGYGSAWAVILFVFCAVIAFAQIKLIQRGER